MQLYFVCFLLLSMSDCIKQLQHHQISKISKNLNILEVLLSAVVMLV